ncbi:MAG: rRNA adenine N-6-methyltransferase family protein [Calditrichota bacterium]
MINPDLAAALSFVKVFLRNPAQVGALAPSSKTLASKMVTDLDLGAGDSILELGPGTGAVTRQIHAILPTETTYLGIEREPKFVKLLDKRFPDLNFITGTAERAKQLCKQEQCPPAKAIISGLPFSSLPGQVREEIISSIDQLMTSGSIFRTFQYVHAYPLPSAIKFRNEMRSRFGHHRRSKVVFKNLPPAFILTWQR